ncbi:MAG: AIR synthase [Clostridiales bacterium]|nr:AIR synthase [Clostridiales bacterium]
MKIGKLTNEELKHHVLDRLSVPRSKVLAGPGVGADCAVLDLDGDACVLSSDPITGTDRDIGVIALNVACNDIAAAGATPVGVMVTLLIPPRATMDELDAIVEDIVKTASALSIDVLGGHTEVTDAVTRTVASVTAIGKRPSKGFKESFTPMDGDSIIMTKSVGLEGAAIIAREYSRAMEKRLTADELNEAREYINSISVVRDGAIGAKNGAYLMHDVTEGGILGAVWELCSNLGKGATVYEDKILITDVVKKICSACRVNPFKLISSGCMLMLARDGEKVVNALQGDGINAAVIGNIKSEGLTLVNKNGSEEIMPPAQDEIYSVRP